MRVLTMAVGATGDVAPYTGLAARLRQAGHEVAIAAAEPFAGMVRQCGAEFRVLPGDPRAAQFSQDNQRWQRGGGGVRGGARLIRLLSEQMLELGEGMLRAARQGADVVLLPGPAYLGGVDIAEGASAARRLATRTGDGRLLLSARRTMDPGPPHSRPHRGRPDPARGSYWTP